MKTPFAILALGLAVTACRPPVNTPAQSEAIVTQITGQVFIVLKNRDTIKLSLVPIALVESNAAATFIRSQRQKFNDRIEEIDSKLKSIDDQIQTALNTPEERAAREAERARDEKETRAREIRDNLRSAWDSYTKTQRNTGLATNQRANQERDVAVAQATKAAQTASAIRSKLADLRTERYSLDTKRHELKLTDYLFGKGVWPSSAVTDTDADGKFAFSANTASNYVLIAAASRQLPLGEKEEYRWIVPVTSNPINLHNDNLYGESSTFLFSADTK